MPAKLMISSNVGEITATPTERRPGRNVLVQGAERDRPGVMVAFGAQGLKRFSALRALSGVSAFSGVRHGH
ncbi:protein of unknown function [Methylorubrum extorquens DM4]|uniref:Uncharacterized protein n=1 Tax=Methylorubrum extorquens (strain DSM 6343 / CIP 106787 / DM4) TaxID=661410 RepID=A0A2P9HAT2_METED|nr:hypothetical protein [Methylorubrum extorquens]SPK02000.1 protein of unknown function [Methylorubrum extorquens DM4]